MESLKNIDDIILLFYPSNNAEHANHGGELYLKEIVIEVWGDLAYFTMPYAKGERLTYPFPTPSAAREILSAIYSKPKEFRWQINRIEVLNPIRYISFKRNEVNERTQRQTTALQDVRYGIAASLIPRPAFAGCEKQLLCKSGLC